jgi:NAD(P)-dependent dehydrogenase (short-subunit alcohol dehydrogenase family)
LINVNAIAPGYVTTEASLAQQGSAETFVMATGGQAIHRRENASDLTGAAVFLGSDESDFITGQVLFVSATPMP